MWGQRKKLNNVAASALPAPPRPVTPPPAPTAWDKIIWSVVGAVIILAVAGWWGMIFVLDAAGYQHPEKALADMVLSLVLAAIIVPIGLLAGRWILALICGLVRDVVREVAQTKVKLKRIEYNAAHALPAHVATRMTSEQRRLFDAVIEVMQLAYKCINEDGRLMTHRQSWSRRSVGAIVLPGEQKAIGEGSALASQVAPLLAELGVLVDERTVNVRDFPPDTGVTKIKELLEDKWGLYVLVGDSVGMTNPHIWRRGT